MIRPLEMTPQALRRAVAAAGQPAYRADQLADWVYRRGVTDPAKMTNLPRPLAAQVRVLSSRVVGRAQAGDETIKLLVEFDDGACVETVLIPTARRATACVSTQVGCAMGCTFCASQVGGFSRNLTAGEMLQQVLHLQGASGRRVTHVVFMGMGEPLANYAETVAAIRAIVDPRRLGLSQRRVTVSTVGLPKAIHRLAREDLSITLAVSLHAANDAIRRQLIPAAQQASVGEVLDAAEAFYRARKREVTLEYVLLGGVNDSRLCAEALARAARRLRCNVNLIRYNPVESLPYRRPSQSATEAFAERLRRRGVNVHVRRSRGLEVAAACGQLRRQRTGKQ